MEHGLADRAALRRSTSRQTALSSRLRSHHADLTTDHFLTRASTQLISLATSLQKSIRYMLKQVLQELCRKAEMVTRTLATSRISSMEQPSDSSTLTLRRLPVLELKQELTTTALSRSEQLLMAKSLARSRASAQTFGLHLKESSQSLAAHMHCT